MISFIHSNARNLLNYYIVLTEKVEEFSQKVMFKSVTSCTQWTFNSLQIVLFECRVLCKEGKCKASTKNKHVSLLENMLCGDTYQEPRVMALENILDV